jgi:hypothetical protein
MSFLEKLKNAKPNLSVLKEYRKREEEFFTRAKDLETITKLRDAQKQKYDGLRKQRLDEFMAGFSLISMKLKEMYQVGETYQACVYAHAFYSGSDDYPRWKCRTGVSR